VPVSGQAITVMVQDQKALVILLDSLEEIDGE
jgi:hypothetical protein